MFYVHGSVYMATVSHSSWYAASLWVELQEMILVAIWNIWQNIN